MNGFVTNIDEMFEKFAEMTSNEMTRAIKRALNRAAAQLQRLTRSNLSSMIKSDTGGNGKYNDRLSDGVMRRSAKAAYDEEMSTVVHVMGRQASGSGTFRLRFLEGGTKERYAQTYKGQPLKKPRYLGQIKPMNFFKNANETIEPQLERIYIEEIDKAIDKINQSN
jgi:HK97 gp10 family phage protein